MIPIHWARLVELARQLDEDYRARGVVDIDVALRLAHGVVAFQRQLIGNLLRTMRRP